MNLFTRRKPTIECPCDRRCREIRFEYESAPPGETAFDLGGQEYRRGYEHCSACGHWFGDHDLDLSGLYVGHYVAETYGEQLTAIFKRIVSLPDHESDNAGRCHRIIEFASRHLPPNAKRTILDVGAGLGVFPYTMGQAGWICTAIDPDQEACRHIQQNVGANVINANFLDIDTSSLGRFDAVTLNKVIEHVLDPCAMLRLAGSVIEPWGFAYIEVPDGEAASQYGPTREEFFIEHDHVFSPTSLCATVERSGLRVTSLDRLIEPSGKFTLACFAVPAIS